MNRTESTSRRFWPVALGVALLMGCLLLLAAAAVAGYLYLWRPPAATAEPAAHYVLDVSERMNRPAAGSSESRLVVARQVMAEVLRPSGLAVAGLRVFGSGAVATGCEDTDLLVAPAPAGQVQITAELDRLEAGATADAALAQAMVAAIRDLASAPAAIPGPKSLVVVTGGSDSCHLEAGRLVAQEAQRAGIELQTFVVGFQVAPAEAEAIKEVVAQAGDALYLDAHDKHDLRQILEVIQRYVEQPVAENLAAVGAWQTSDLPEPVNLTQNPGLAYGPQLVLDDDNRLHLVWWDNSNRNRGEVLYRQRLPEADWSEGESLTLTFDAHIAQYEVQLRLRPDGAVCAFWTVLDELSYYQRCRSREGWEPAQAVYAATGIRRAFQPAFGPDGRLHLLYLDSAGEIYSGDLKLSGETAAAYPALAVDAGGRLHAAWFSYGQPYTIEYRWSDDGQSWGEAESLVVATSLDLSAPALRADGSGNVHLAWSADEGVYYRRWTPAAGWEAVVVVSDSHGRSECDNIALDIDGQGVVHLAWHTHTGLYYTHREAPQQQWAMPRLVSGGPCTLSRVPVLAAGADGLVHLVWSPKEPESDLYYAAWHRTGTPEP
jgi:hypothetical protein